LMPAQAGFFMPKDVTLTRARSLMFARPMKKPGVNRSASLPCGSHRARLQAWR
jgi:hypothetical protein